MRKVGSYCEQLPSVGWCRESGGQWEHLHHQQVLQPLVCVISGATQQVSYALTVATMKMQSQVVTIKSTAALTDWTERQRSSGSAQPSPRIIMRIIIIALSWPGSHQPPSRNTGRMNTSLHNLGACLRIKAPKVKGRCEIQNITKMWNLKMSVKSVQNFSDSLTNTEQITTIWNVSIFKLKIFQFVVNCPFCLKASAALIG